MKLISAILCSSFFVACEPKERTSEDQIKLIELAKESFQDFNAHNWQKHAMHFSDSCKYLDPSYGTIYKIVTRKEKAEKYEMMERWSPDIHDDISSIFSSGEKVVVQFTSSGTAKTENGELKWTLPICCIFTFKNGLIVIDETYYDRGK